MNTLRPVDRLLILYNAVLIAVWLRAVPVSDVAWAGAGAHAFGGDRRVDVLPSRHFGFEDLLVVFAVEHPQEPVLAGRRYQLTLAAADDRVVDRTDLGEVPVVVIGRHQLLVPAEIAAADIESDDRVGEEVLARSGRLGGEIGRRIGHRHVELLGLGVEGEGRPHGTTAQNQAVCGSLETSSSHRSRCV